jgi:hypothetical protein
MVDNQGRIHDPLTSASPPPSSAGLASLADSEVTVSMFEALDALSQREPHHEHEMREHDDVCDDACPISAAVISPEGLE